jgi:hypothetical protein
VIRYVQMELQPCKDALHDLTLDVIVSLLSCHNHITILQGKDTRQWLLVLPSAANGTKLLAQEYRDTIILHYTRSPADLQSHCDGCGQKFSVCHVLGCKKGGLVIMKSKTNQAIWPPRPSFPWRFSTNPKSTQVAPPSR